MPVDFPKLRSMSESDLIDRYNDAAFSVNYGPGYLYQLTRHGDMQVCLTELNRRSQDRQTMAMLGYTRRITGMTCVITLLTLVNVVFVALQVYRMLIGS